MLLFNAFKNPENQCFRSLVYKFFLYKISYTALLTLIFYSWPLAKFLKSSDVTGAILIDKMFLNLHTILPRLVWNLVMNILAYFLINPPLAALTREGIYRVPGFRAKLNELKSMYNRGKIFPTFLTSSFFDLFSHILHIFYFSSTGYILRKHAHT